LNELSHVTSFNSTFLFTTSYCCRFASLTLLVHNFALIRQGLQTVKHSYHEIDSANERA